MPREQWPGPLCRGEVRGVFVGGCVEGSAWPADTAAHAHVQYAIDFTDGTWKINRYRGWVCFEDGVALVSRKWVLHELAHIMTGDGHTRRWRRQLAELEATTPR